MGRGLKAGKRSGARKQSRGNQMAQIQAMQTQMAAAQERVETLEAEAGAGGGAVSVKVNGKHELVSVKLEPEIVDPDDIEMLQDLIIAATNEAMRQVDEMASAEMSKITGGIGLPPGLL